MLGKIFKAVYILAFAFVIGLLIYALFLTEEKDYKLISKAVALVVTYVAASLRAMRRRNKENSTHYKDIISGAFCEDSKNNRKIRKVIDCYSRSRYKKAHRLLDELEPQCRYTKDYSAVYKLRALCYVAEKEKAQAVKAYEKFLQYDKGDANIWCYIAQYYWNEHRNEEARNAFNQAGMLDPENGFIHNNLSHLSLESGDMEAAVQHALKAIELGGNEYLAMRTASVAYKALGDDENAEKYCKMYGEKGGDVESLKKTLSCIKRRKES